MAFRSEKMAVVESAGNVDQSPRILFKPSPIRPWEEMMKSSSVSTWISDSPPTKRRKLSPGDNDSQNRHAPPTCAGLPASVWQLVISYLPPNDLGRVLQVNKAFYCYLVSVHKSDRPYLAGEGANLQEIEEIWATARRLFHPDLPGPFPGNTELDMWKLMHGKRCQLCSSEAQVECPDPSQKAGSGVRVFWQIPLRSCLECLKTKTLKEDEVLQYPYLSRPGLLPYVLAAEDFSEFYSLSDFRSSREHHVCKFFYTPHVLERLRSFRYAEYSGRHALDSLTSRYQKETQRQMKYAIRWERVGRKISFVQNHQQQHEALRTCSTQNEEFQQSASDIDSQEETLSGLSPCDTDNTSLAFSMETSSKTDLNRESPPRSTTQASSRLSVEEAEANDPTNQCLGRHADDIIRSTWNGGGKVNADNAAKFVVAVLTVVRHKFFQGQQADTSALHLRNMKWVYDHKIKPFSEQRGKEIFCCSACRTSRRLYTFEGVLLHYGAKHTNKFSSGSAVVDWHKADWPKDLPFSAPFQRNTQSPAQLAGAFGRPREYPRAFQSPHPVSAFLHSPQPPAWRSLPPPPTSMPQHNGSTHTNGHCGWDFSPSCFVEYQQTRTDWHPASTNGVDDQPFPNPVSEHTPIHYGDYNILGDENSDQYKFRRYEEARLNIARQEEHASLASHAGQTLELFPPANARLTQATPATKYDLHRDYYT